MNAQQALAELGRADLEPALHAALSRYRRDGHLGRSRPELPAEAWAALSRLTGQPAGPHVLDLALLDEALRRSRYALSLPEVLSALNGGPIPVRRQLRQNSQRAWEALLQTVDPLEWREALQRSEAGANLLKAALNETPQAEASARAALVGQAILSQQLAPERLPILAARLTGNAHAFDTDQAAGRLLRAALAGLEQEQPPRDGVSSCVLQANLSGPDWLSGAAGHTLLLPWREVARIESFTAAGDQLWIVENPSVFEAVHEVWPTAPLLCTQGQPSAAAVLVLSRLKAGTRLQLSCDLDWGGLSIAASLRRRVAGDWKPWRMDAAAHQLACSRGAAPLRHDPSAYAGDFPELVAALQRTRQGAHQENLLPELLTDVKGSF